MSYSAKELRFWSNWAFIILISPLYSTSRYSIFSSFHQFVTNPTEAEIHQQENPSDKDIEPGLGETEFFYSMLISVTNLGAVMGGVISGFLSMIVPYWYLWAIPLSFNAIAYVIHSISFQGWLIMISRFLSGYFVGAIITLSFNYFTISSSEYVKLKEELGKKTDVKESFRLRNYLFSMMGIGYSIGFVFGSGVTVIAAQFKSVSQFRTIGWFNVAYTGVGLCLLLFMFHEEMKWKKTKQWLQFCSSTKFNFDKELGVLSLFIILSLLVFAMMEKVRFSFILTLFNPIASDSFGIDERGASYLFLILSPFLMAGSVLLIILQKLKVSSQAITLLAISTTMVGYLIVTDWQTIPYDPCTELSPFHHPNLVAMPVNVSQSSALIESSRETRDLKVLFPGGTSSALPKLVSINLLSDVDIDLGTGSTISFEANLGTSFSCRQTNSCDCNQLLPSGCLKFFINGTADTYIGEDTYKCSSSFNQRSPIPLCVYFSNGLPTDIVENAQIQSVMEIAVTPAKPELDIYVLSESTYEIVRNNCIQANVTGHQCHWIPSSDIFNEECEDCPPICRSVHQTLSFAQYIIGNGLLVFATALQTVPVVAMIMNQSPEQIQGILLGCMTAGNAVARTLAPLLLDAGYEEFQKRIYLLTILLAFLQFPYIIELVLLYSKLGPKPEEKGKKRDEHKYTKLEPVLNK